ncbi:nuclear condensing complex subunit, partial [Dichotomocladium elegans]
EALYQNLRNALFDRIKDKEAPIRIQAATALARLQNADEEVDEKDGRTITAKLLWLLQHDPSAKTIPYIIERARDIDAINRRVVFLKPMAEIEDFRILTTQQRSDLLKWGLNDRDPLVRQAASKMLANHWIRHTGNNLLKFIERIDLLEGSGAEDILTAFLNARPDIVNTIKLEEHFWDTLSVEGAFMAKVFIKFLKANKLEDMLDDILPEVTRHAFLIQTYKDLWRDAPKETEVDYEFIVGQLLDIAKCLDYGDEVGRRKMFVLLREMLTVPEVPDDHLASIVELFKIISLDERDFTRTMVEIIADIQEQIDADNNNTGSRARTEHNDDHDDDYAIVKVETEESSAAEAEAFLLRKSLFQLKCLTICKYMLEQSEESLQDNSTLYGVLNDLIVPSVQSKEVVLREEGLHCLGLCCILDKNLGHHNIPLFIHCVKNGHEELQQKALMILFDLIMIYGLPAIQEKLDDADELRNIFEICLDHDSQVIQSTAVEGLAKLMLTRVYKDESILKLLVILYFFPATFDNIKIQQCLSYFFPAYCYSAFENQQRMAKVAIPAILELCEIYKDLGRDEKMVSPSQIADMLADWTDPRKIATSKITTGDKSTVDMNLQATLAFDILKAIFRHPGLVLKTMVHMLLKIHIADADQDHLKVIKLLIERIEDEKPIKETMVRNSFHRFCKAVDKYYIPESEEVQGNGDGQAEDEEEQEEEEVRNEDSVDDDLDDVISEEN